MAHRRHGTVASIALWALIAVGDLAIIIINASMAVLLVLAGVVTAGLCATAAWLARRTGAARAAIAEAGVVPATIDTVVVAPEPKLP